MLESKLSLADFFASDSEDPLVPPADFSDWLDRSAWALSLMEPAMAGAVGPRMTIDRAGRRGEVVNLSSYNYLGLATHPEVIAAATRALAEYGMGACGSPLLSGMSDRHRELEAALSSLLDREDTMLFNSGFAGGLGSLAGVLRKGDVAILDQKCHLCLIDGAKLSRAQVQFFDHNDPGSLDAALARAAGRRRLVVVEGVYSMDGDLADLPALAPVLESHRAGLFIDEAHSILVYGKGGRGVTDHFGMKERVGLLFATFSKGFAALGGFVSGRRDLLRYMRYYTNPYGFSCALPPAVVAGVRAGLEVATRDDALRTRLWDNVRHFREGCTTLGLDTGRSTSQVVPIIIGSDRRKLYEMCLEMNRRGLFLAPVDYPSVPEDGLRYRVAITAAHEKADLDQALGILEDVVVPAIGPRA